MLCDLDLQDHQHPPCRARRCASATPRKLPCRASRATRATRATDEGPGARRGGWSAAQHPRVSNVAWRIVQHALGMNPLWALTERRVDAGG